jgi:hypothetical protein
MRPVAALSAGCRAVVFVAVCTGFVQQVIIPASRPGGQTQPARNLFDQLASEHIHLLQCLASNVCGSVCCCLSVVLLLQAQGLCSSCTEPASSCRFYLADCDDQHKHVEAQSHGLDIIVSCFGCMQAVVLHLQAEVLLVCAQGLCSTCTGPATGCRFYLADCDDKHVEAPLHGFDLIVCCSGRLQVVVLLLCHLQTGVVCSYCMHRVCAALAHSQTQTQTQAAGSTWPPPMTRRGM